jgi:hypothetical protein
MFPGSPHALYIAFHRHYRRLIGSLIISGTQRYDKKIGANWIVLWLLDIPSREYCYLTKYNGNGWRDAKPSDCWDKDGCKLCNGRIY